MLLKTFDKHNVAVKTEYTVWNKAGDLLDYFLEDYTNPLESNVIKKLDLVEKGAKVKYVSVNSATGRLSVSVEVE